MKEREFQLVDKLADELNARCDEWFESSQMAEFKQALCQISAALPEGHTLELSVELRVLDESRKGHVRMLTVGLCCHGDSPPFRVSGDSTPERYIVDGELCEVPHDYCPRCWGAWDFKLMHQQCPECGCRMGPDLKLLLDRDTCPKCEKGHVSVNQPTCTNCGFHASPEYVTWG